MKEAELRAISAKLKPSGLDVFPVAADGHCLFRVRVAPQFETFRRPTSP